MPSCFTFREHVPPSWSQLSVQIWSFLCFLWIPKESFRGNCPDFSLSECFTFSTGFFHQSFRPVVEKPGAVCLLDDLQEYGDRSFVFICGFCCLSLNLGIETESKLFRCEQAHIVLIDSRPVCVFWREESLKHWEVNWLSSRWEETTTTLTKRPPMKSDKTLTLCIHSRWLQVSHLPPDRRD